MPKPNPRESKKDFVNRCVPIVIKEGTAKDGSQGSAICNSIWEDHQKNKGEAMGFDAQDDRKPTSAQTLIFSKKNFPTKESALSWAKENHFNSDTIRETTNSWRIRQRPPSDFAQTSFRLKSFMTGVSAVVGHLNGGD